MRTGGDGVMGTGGQARSHHYERYPTLMIIKSATMRPRVLIQMLGMDRIINRMAAELGLKEAVLGRKMMDSKRKTGAW